MNSNKILIVDDEDAIRKILLEILRPEGYEFSFASDGKEAMELIRRQTVDLVLTDVRMPKMDGVQLATSVKQYSPDVEIIMVTGMADLDLVVKTLQLGAYDYILKPFQKQRVLMSVERALERRRLILGIKECKENVEQVVKERTRALEDRLKKLTRTYQTTLQTLGAVLDSADIEAQARCLRVTKYARAVTKRLSLRFKEIAELEAAIALCYVGKVTLAEAGSLMIDAEAKAEWERQHQGLDKPLLKAIELLERGLPIICSQQECWDGSGRPQGLKGDEIPVAARILAVIHTFDDLSSDQPYRKALSFTFVRERLANKAGTQFDPKITEAFLEIPDLEIAEICRLAVEALVRMQRDLTRA
jgi:response regulator RpfG family c-di-GMP phosphodiesterase